MLKIVILGVTGMLGHVLYSYLAARPGLELYGVSRNKQRLRNIFPENLFAKIRDRIAAEDFDALTEFLAETQPQIIINCIGIIKQKPEAGNLVKSITTNALFPHRLAIIARALGAKLIHISTDCVFDGEKGGYTETDPPNPSDIYGRTKLLGEVDYPPALTIRTSIIGHELDTKYGLVEWFLSQTETVPGFTKAIYSGLPTIELAEIIDNYVLSRPKLSGLYQISANPISKYRLLGLIAAEYRHQVEIEPQEQFQSDRSLDSTLFRKQTGYQPRPWPELIAKMRRHFETMPYYQNKGKI